MATNANTAGSVYQGYFGKMLLKFFAEGVVLGATLLPACIMTCGPIYIPFVLTRAEKGLKSGAILVLKLVIARFVAYIGVGMLSGVAGGEIPEKTREIIVHIAFVVLSGLLFYNSIRPPILTGCPRKFFGKTITSPYLLGFLTGLNLCPPFLIALTEAARSGGILSGAILFLGLGISSSFFFLPFSFLNILKKSKIIPIFAQGLGILVSLYFFVIGGSGLVLDFFSHSGTKNYIVLGIDDVDSVFIYESGLAADSALYSELKSNFAKPVSIENIEKLKTRTRSIIFAFEKTEKEKLEELSGKGNLVITFPIEKEKAEKLIAFLKEYAFKVDTIKGTIFDAAH